MSVASVQLQDDCPGPKPAAKRATAPKAAMEPPAKALEDIDQGDMAGDAPMARRAKPGTFDSMCRQSTLQLSIESSADAGVAFAIKDVRIRLADGDKALGTMATRNPTVWNDSKYEAWDEQVPAGASLKAGYAIGHPNWAEVEKASGKSSWGPMFILDVDVEVDGVVRTISSPKVPRNEPVNIVT